MIAMLALCPIRLKNFAALEIGRSVTKQAGTWWIVLRDTKTRRPDERPIPDYLNEAIDRYLGVYRPHLLNAGRANPRTAGDFENSARLREGALWIGQAGRDLSYGLLAERS
jgi:hypothetical protein